MVDIEFTPNEVNIQNITELSKKQSRLFEKRLCEIYELASVAADIAVNMLREDYGIYEILSIISVGFSDKSSPVHSSCLKENEKMLVSYIENADVYGKASFSKLFLDVLSSRGIKISEISFFDENNTRETVSFVKNQLSSEAYDVFSEEFNDPRLKYAADMKEAVSMLVNDVTGYCILPLEERGGARLSAITEILFKEDLKINSVTPVFGPYGGADMKYALVSKNVSVPDIQPGDDRYLEIRIKADSSGTLSQILTVARAFGIGIYRVNTISFSTEEGDIPYISLVLKNEEADFSTMLVYLTLFVSDYTSVGIYKNLE